MSKSEVLYVKGMNLSESEEEEYVWDDRKLNDAYDKAIRIANAEVAKRVAMSTNTQSNNDSMKQSTSKNKSKSPPQKSRASKTAWKAGMPCQAIYEEDGLEYEAIILSIVNDKECIVQFLGYNNLQMVSLNTLNPSLDRHAQTRQVEKALLDRADDGFESQSPNVEDMEYSDRASPRTDASHQNRKKPGKKKNKTKPVNNFNLPDIPMPNLAMLKNLGSMDMPLPPPPPIHLSRGEVESEDQAISSMLLSWYMSGYYTGLYQGMKRAKEGRGDK